MTWRSEQSRQRRETILRALRADARAGGDGLSSEALAARVGMSPQAIGNILRGLKLRASGAGHGTVWRLPASEEGEYGGE